MNLEQQVCSPDLAKRLRELGVKQDSLFWWVWSDNWNTAIIYLDDSRDIDAAVRREYQGDIENPQWCSAFTVAELGEMLPRQYTTWRDDKGFFVEGYNEKVHRTFEEATTEADARAKMLIYLLENKLITV